MVFQKPVWKKFVLFVCSLAFWLLFWHLAAVITNIPILLPTPVSVAKTLFSLLPDGSFWLTVFSSLLRVTAGFFLGLFLGAILALAVSFIPLLESFFSVPISCLKTAPVASFIILVNLWLQTEQVTVLISFLMVLPLAYRSLLEALRARDEQMLIMAKHYRLTRLQIFLHLSLPSMRAALKSVCSVGMGFAWKAGVAAEVIVLVPHSLGEQLYDAKVFLETEQLFAWTIVVILVSLLLEKGLALLFRKEGGR
ncbi:MAG: ABC transporter permease subunit [Oscillospiraceae bacterium]|nr:ABC transporter permease subunit [Oscillospiraceae bacterium]MBQ4101326.1 ABC transporter permease subunit [Oscillospiraceae bacterium]